jgi:GT2 family glycosyltransferase
MKTFACSIVIPSCNRADKLDLLLCALAAQDIDLPLEVIVVLDGSTDDSRDVLGAWERLDVFASLRWCEQSRKGQATARNTGSFLARAPILLFLDDDVVPEPDLVSTHLGRHASGDRIAVLGDCPIVRSDSGSFCELATWAWWEDTNYRRSSHGQPASYRDFCTGNVSLRREDFARLGGFDQDFTGYGREDYELGYRLLQSGVRFVADGRARARHYNTATVRNKCDAARQEAHGDVLIARKHPELINGLRLASAGDRRTRVAAWLAMVAPWLGAPVCLVARGLLAIYERLRLRRRWQARFDFLWAYSYSRGLRDSLGSMDALRALRQDALPRLTQQIDVARALVPQVALLNIDVPSSLIVVCKDAPVGTIDLRPNMSEPLLPWLVREISSRLSAELLLEFARAALLREVEGTHPDTTVLGTG